MQSCSFTLTGMLRPTSGCAGLFLSVDDNEHMHGYMNKGVNTSMPMIMCPDMDSIADECVHIYERNCDCTDMFMRRFADMSNYELSYEHTLDLLKMYERTYTSAYDYDNVR